MKQDRWTFKILWSGNGLLELPSCKQVLPFKKGSMTPRAADTEASGAIVGLEGGAWNRKGLLSDFET